ncbi:hypothetical protein N7510_007579 [Penicillium lagena]|uniref:uncharacterized protein n=1 Tax=Penicillium lagena TaxID=94218 RepID=UPI00253FB0D1|nr:uncharacterized protein N7510_007579 [Penicillium lagena]KAJ5610860.1 hypothetical protein N7510_007579 [Penicillium lagena]
MEAINIILPLQKLGCAPLHHVSEELQPASTRTLYDAKLSDGPRERGSLGVASLGAGRDPGLRCLRGLSLDMYSSRRLLASTVDTYTPNLDGPARSIEVSIWSDSASATYRDHGSLARTAEEGEIPESKLLSVDHGPDG